uniref:Uncharacterized protein n=1 Tax=Solanum tuberosum TaxID=4113 RepID=M1CPB1_SOLTU
MLSYPFTDYELKIFCAYSYILKHMQPEEEAVISSLKQLYASNNNFSAEDISVRRKDWIEVVNFFPLKLIVSN